MGKKIQKDAQVWSTGLRKRRQLAGGSPAGATAIAADRANWRQ